MLMDIMDRTKVQGHFGMDQMSYGRFGQDQMSANLLTCKAVSGALVY